MDLKVAPKADNATLRRARKFGTLVYADGFLFTYLYRGNLYVMQPPEPLRDEVTESLPPSVKYDFVEPTGRPVDAPVETAHQELEYDPAVLMHFTHEMAYCLREMRKMFTYVPLRFQQSGPLLEADELLEQYATEYLGGDWDDYDEADKKMRDHILG